MTIISSFQTQLNLSWSNAIFQVLLFEWVKFKKDTNFVCD